MALPQPLSESMTQTTIYNNVALTVGMMSLSVFASFGTQAIAQVTPDESLGPERTTVKRNVNSPRGAIDRIEGGAIRGSNLFHSFADFNVRNLEKVYFSNPSLVDNIISRVTGSTQSNILGTLGVLGNANLFLINPNGVVFGPNAVLDVTGSFLASTSDQLQFENGYAFSATEANAPPPSTAQSPCSRSAKLAAPVRDHFHRRGPRNWRQFDPGS